jgi:Probable zinc-ribbon domain
MTQMSKQEMADVQLLCAACGDPFVFSAGEQELYRLRGISLQPEHCPSCARSRTHMSTATQTA